jgi:hypothetical protein
MALGAPGERECHLLIEVSDKALRPSNSLVLEGLDLEHLVYATEEIAETIPPNVYFEHLLMGIVETESRVTGSYRRTLIFVDNRDEIQFGRKNS